jgi:6-phosphogluconolactonase
MTQVVNWKPFDSIELLAEAVCQRILGAADKAIANKSTHAQLHHTLRIKSDRL